MKPDAEVLIAGPNERIDRFVEERLEQIDVTLSPLERRSVLKFAPYFRWATDDELRELLRILTRHAAHRATPRDMTRAAALGDQRGGRLMGKTELGTKY
ncbi:hypothetical protein, partial [Burkholderia pseudomallei]|uniref:hypothetical protein n=1 Tax=Burkholderia pseudomallei TaxID=28450 RepID=UPI0021166C9D